MGCRRRNPETTTQLTRRAVRSGSPLHFNSLREVVAGDGVTGGNVNIRSWRLGSAARRPIETSSATEAAGQDRRRPRDRGLGRSQHVGRLLQDARNGRTELLLDERCALRLGGRYDAGLGDLRDESGRGFALADRAHQARNRGLNDDSHIISIFHKRVNTRRGRASARRTSPRPRRARKNR
jgi:hypothetical protein